MSILLIAVLLILAIALVVVIHRLRTAAAEGDRWRSEHARLTERFKLVVDVEAERARVLEALRVDQETARRALAELSRERETSGAELRGVQSSIVALRSELAALDEESNLQSFGFYKPRYDFAESKQYQERLDRIRDDQKAMLKEKSAAVCNTEWSVNGSKVEGRKQINQTIKLMLRAFNGECDAAIARVKYNNVHVMEARMRKAHEMINSLAQVQQCLIVFRYLDLKLQELYLSHEYEEKVQQEKDEQRRIREQMREEEIAQRELEKAKQDAEREEARYAQALARAREDAEKAAGAKQLKLQSEIEELTRRLAEAQTNKQRAIARAQMTRSGHVYVISNVGSFGEHVYKIGMTRRLDPLDRIRELGDASVPFQFDVHAVIFADDAPALENALHRIFDRHRVNRVNDRKEFFRVAIDEIAAAVRQHHGHIDFTLMAEAAEYRKTLAILTDEQKQTVPPPVGPAQIPIRAAGAAARV